MRGRKPSKRMHHMMLYGMVNKLRKTEGLTVREACRVLQKNYYPDRTEGAIRQLYLELGRLTPDHDANLMRYSRAGKRMMQAALAFEDFMKKLEEGDPATCQRMREISLRMASESDEESSKKNAVAKMWVDFILK